MKKFLTILAITLSIFTYSAATYGIYTAVAATPTKNYLIIPKPETLPGPTVTTQGESGKLLTWFSTKILPKWAVGMVGFVGIASFLMLVVSGIRYMTLYGNEEGAGKAKKMIIYSIVGLLISMFAYTIVTIIVNLNLSSTT
jgi:hypothetical protein